VERHAQHEREAADGVQGVESLGVAHAGCIRGAAGCGSPTGPAHGDERGA